MAFMRNMDKEALDHLRTLGFNQYESRLYLALLQSGAMSASELSDNADIPRPRTYDVLDELAKRGFVRVQPGRPTRFQAFPISEAFKNLKNEKQALLEKQFDEIDKTEKRLVQRMGGLDVVAVHSPSDMIWVLKERSNIYSKAEDMMRNASESIIISSSKEGIKRKLSNYEDVLRAAKSRGVKVRLVTPDATAAEIKRAAEYANVQEAEGHHRMVIADDEALLFLTPEEDEKSEIAAWIRSPHFTETLRRNIK
jgi:sugar-specific transcriptional regulator TrmB